MCSVEMIHGSFFGPSLDELAAPILKSLFMMVLMAECRLRNVAVAVKELGKSHPDMKILPPHRCFFYHTRVCVCFFCPDVQFSDRGNVLMSPEQCAFSFGSVDPLADEEEGDIFNP